MRKKPCRKSKVSKHVCRNHKKMAPKRKKLAMKHAGSRRIQFV